MSTFLQVITEEQRDESGRLSCPYCKCCSKIKDLHRQLMQYRIRVVMKLKKKAILTEDKTNENEQRSQDMLTIAF